MRSRRRGISDKPRPACAGVDPTPKAASWASGLDPPQPVYQDAQGSGIMIDLGTTLQRAIDTLHFVVSMVDHCDDCGIAISGGECWLGLCKGCESDLAKDPTQRDRAARQGTVVSDNEFSRWRENLRAISCKWRKAIEVLDAVSISKLAHVQPTHLREIGRNAPTEGGSACEAPGAIPGQETGSCPFFSFESERAPEGG